MQRCSSGRVILVPRQSGSVAAARTVVALAWHYDGDAL